LLVYPEQKKTIINQVSIEAQRTNNITNYFTGRERPEAIILNPNDKAYFTQVFEQRTAAWLCEHVHVDMN
jgi:hypothetical protein